MYSNVHLSSANVHSSVTVVSPHRLESPVFSDETIKKKKKKRRNRSRLFFTYVEYQSYFTRSRFVDLLPFVVKLTM